MLDALHMLDVLRRICYDESCLVLGGGGGRRGGGGGVFLLMIRRPPRSTLDRSSAASDVYKRQQYSHDQFNERGGNGCS